MQLATDRTIAPEGGAMVTIHTDPVCGMEVTPKTAVGRFDFRGVTYYFCSAGCKKTFEEDP